MWPSWSCHGSTPLLNCPKRGDFFLVKTEDGSLGFVILVKTEDGSLGFVSYDARGRMYMWKRVFDANGAGEWAQRSAIGQNSNGKCQEDGNHDSEKDDGMAGDEDYSDLDLAWKMLENARVIVEKSPNHTMQKVKIFSALAAVSMEREDIDNSLDDYFKALAILDNLVDPDNRQIVTLNRGMCSVSELAFKIGDAIPYCAKAFSSCESRMLNLRKAKGDNGDKASSAKGRSEKYALKDVTELLTDILTELETKHLLLKGIFC